MSRSAPTGRRPDVVLLLSSVHTRRGSPTSLGGRHLSLLAGVALGTASRRGASAVERYWPAAAATLFGIAALLTLVAGVTIRAER